VLGRPRVKFVLVCFLVLMASRAAWAQQVGTITQLTGTAQVLRAGVTNNVTLTMPVDLNDRLTTAAASTLTLTLTDNSTLSLLQPGTLVVDQNVVTGGVRQRSLVRLLGGTVNAVVNVAGRAIAPNNFQIVTPNAIVGVRGTNFDVSYTEGVVRPGFDGCQRYTDVVVHDGVVAISNPSTPAAVVEVGAGFETTVPCLLPPLNAGPIGIAGAAGPGAAGGRTAAATVGGFSAPSPGVGSSPPPAPAVPKVVQ
jgi:ferric-dicitrate binding protein FerR (iron transport regulator)